jgi:hypothetical protein
MKQINLQCAGDNSNTGVPSCSWSPSNITGAILVPKGKAYTVTDVATMWASLQADIIDDAPASRIYPILPFKAFDDQSTDIQIETDGYGGKSFVRDGDYDWVFELKNGFCFYQSLRSFHNKNLSWDVLFIDEVNNTLWGTENADGDLTGFALELLLVPNIKLNTGAAATKYYVRFALSSPAELNDATYTVTFPTNQQLMKLSGLIDTYIAAANATIDATSGDCDLNLNAGCASIDMAELYASELVDATPAYCWQAYNVTQAAAVAITGVAVAGSTITVTTNAAQHAPADIVQIWFGEVSDAIAVGITGFAASPRFSFTVV